jgi:hypothetical protein
MKAEDEPISDDEFVLRLIHPRYFSVNLGIPIHPEAFRPLDSGEEGISVFRAACATPAQVLGVVAQEKRSLFYVARLAVSELKGLGLSVKPDRIEAVPGHAIIPEINTSDYRQNKLFWKGVQKKLAELASKEIVHRPGI